MFESLEGGELRLEVGVGAFRGRLRYRLVGVGGGKEELRERRGRSKVVGGVDRGGLFGGEGEGFLLPIVWGDTTVSGRRGREEEKGSGGKGLTPPLLILLTCSGNSIFFLLNVQSNFLSIFCNLEYSLDSCSKSSNPLPLKEGKDLSVGFLFL